MVEFEVVGGVLTKYNGFGGKVKLPADVEVIGKSVFAGKTSITQLELSQNVKKIEELAFEGCSELEHFILKNALETIGSNAFKDCTKLKTVTLPSTLATKGNNKFIKDYYKELNINHSITIVKYPYGIKKVLNGGTGNIFSIRFLTEHISGDLPYEEIEIIIPTGVELIGENAFRDKGYLGKITIPSSVKVIEDDAFHQCVDARIEILSDEKNPSQLEHIGERAFIGCFKFNETFDIPDTVQFIGSSAFGNCTSLTSVKLPSGLETIGPSAFSSCLYRLETVTYYGEGIPNINTSNFYKCKALNDSSKRMLKGLGFKID